MIVQPIAVQSAGFVLSGAEKQSGTVQWQEPDGRMAPRPTPTTTMTTAHVLGEAINPLQFHGVYRVPSGGSQVMMKLPADGRPLAEDAVKGRIEQNIGHWRRHGFGLWGLSSVVFLILGVSTFLFFSSQNQELKAYRSLGIKIDKVGSTYFCTIPLGTADSNTRVVGIIPYKNENDRISVTENQNIIFVRGIPESSLK